MKRTTFSSALVLLLFSSHLFASSAEKRTAAYLESIRYSHPNKLANFIQALPKGGDLHNHESGATYAENLLNYAYKDNLCVDRATYTALNNPSCEQQNLLEVAVQDKNFKEQLIDAWSMHDFTSKDVKLGHDHFFAAFSKFSAITGPHHGEILAEIANRAANENELYLELMVTADGNESGKLGKALGWDPDFATMRTKLLANGFDKIIADMTMNLNADEASMRSDLACGTNQAQAGCQLQIRYLYQVLREQAPEMVFAQLLAGFEVAAKEPRIVGINLVQPEDGTISMRDYDLQMQMINYLQQIYPGVNVSLHAGELSDAIVPNAGSYSHIRSAIEVAHAKRIGHGVDIMSEDNATSLLTEMAQHQNLVEINLTSNAEILGVSGHNHPLAQYLQNNVPVTLSTDDEGVSRSNLTHEYITAVSNYSFVDYITLKTFSRNSLEYAFIPGQSVWKDNSYKHLVAACAMDDAGTTMPSQTCGAFLKANPKAQLQWKLEHRFNLFEARYS